MPIHRHLAPRRHRRRYWPVAKILTLNTFLHDIRLFGRIPVYPPAPFVAERMAALPDALDDIDADVVCLQEVFRRPHRAFIAERMRRRYRHSVGLRHPGLPLGSGLMILSRHPISSAGPKEYRSALFEERLAIRMGYLGCVTELPDLGPFRLINTHLVACGLGTDPEGRRGETCRSLEIGELLREASPVDGMPTIIAGDFNCGPHTSAENFGQILAGGFVDLAASSGAGDAMSWDPGNPLVTGKNLALPRQRIDHILLHQADFDRWRPASVRIVLDECRVATVAGTRVPVSDHYGLLTTIGPVDAA